MSFANDPDENSDRLNDDDIFIQRDEEDELLPVEEEVPLMGGTAKVVPMAYGKVQRVFGGMQKTDQIEPEVVADILREHVVEPDLSGLSDDDMRKSMKPVAPQALMMTVLRASGVTGELTKNAQGEAEMDLDMGNQG